jgi:hypothetical protein
MFWMLVWMATSSRTGRTEERTQQIKPELGCGKSYSAEAKRYKPFELVNAGKNRADKLRKLPCQTQVTARNFPTNATLATGGPGPGLDPQQTVSHSRTGRGTRVRSIREKKPGWAASGSATRRAGAKTDTAADRPGNAARSRV